MQKQSAAQIALTVTNIIDNWKEIAPNCDCGQKGNPVIYVCKVEKCPMYSKQKLYCFACLEKGDHEHYKHVKIADELQGLQVKWSELMKGFTKLQEKATSAY